MKTKTVCNDAVIRFLPYPETEEFVNVGVILACPETRTVDYKLETRRRERITGFFPELDAGVFIEGRHSFKCEMDRIKDFLGNKNPRQTEFRKMNNFPNETLFVVQCPKSDKKAKAADEVIKELKHLETIVVSETEDQAILNFAKAI